jgi:hypothetical protein
VSGARPGIAIFLALLVAACAEERAHAPIGPRAAWLLEPSRIGVGQVTTLELAVTTPPDHAIEPYAPPPAPPGVALVGSEALPVEKEGARWLHRIRLRLRATTTGTFAWPSSTIGLQAADGSTTQLELPEHPIQVVSILPEYPDRVSPFGARAWELPRRPSAPVWVPALLGAATALSAVALVALARRRRRAAVGSPAEPGPSPGAPAWALAREGLEAVRSVSAGDPFAAAHGLSLTLRRFVDRRFGAATRGLSGEELRAGEPPFAARSRWPALLAILADLDELRFRPGSDTEARDALAARLAELISSAERFVEDAVPPDARLRADTAPEAGHLGTESPPAEAR